MSQQRPFGSVLYVSVGDLLTKKYDDQKTAVVIPVIKKKNFLSIVLREYSHEAYDTPQNIAVNIAGK
jgi:hypothetical protein